MPRLLDGRRERQPNESEGWDWKKPCDFYGRRAPSRFTAPPENLAELGCSVRRLIHSPVAWRSQGDLHLSGPPQNSSLPWKHVYSIALNGIKQKQTPPIPYWVAPNTTIYQSSLFYKPGISRATAAVLGIPSEIPVKCHDLRQIPEQDSRETCKTKNCRPQAKQRPATGHHKRHLSRHQENSSLTEIEPYLDTGPLSVQDGIQEADGKVEIVKLTSTAAATAPGMVLALIILVASVVIVLFAMVALLLCQRCCAVAALS
ncbi:uncharacterized protein LOC128329510 [Hemicordylus capensis]|uniref:uncharacterized protein LOC128329510 n=1 Tax=Hemicordylus capensis TaxID=884348 RepID=UPI0023048672|nr:uncharacterized protein LOC128329510 [Hemicordylus capensis]